MIILLTTFFLFPLCSLKSLAALAPFSLLGLGGTLYTAAFMFIRFFDGSYKSTGRFATALPAALRPVFSLKGKGVKLDHTIFVLISMLSTAFIAHYNAPSFYSELKDTSMPRFNAVVGGAFGFSILIYIAMMSVGFLTFGGNSAGFILNNYSGKDVLATVARIAVGASIVTSFPFTFTALRDGVSAIFKIDKEKQASQRTPLTVLLLAVITSLALVLRDVGFVQSLSGAMFGSALMFVMPAIMRLGSARKGTTPRNRAEALLDHGLLVTGVLSAVIGVAVSVLRELGRL